MDHCANTYDSNEVKINSEHGVKSHNFTKKISHSNSQFEKFRKAHEHTCELSYVYTQQAYVGITKLIKILACLTDFFYIRSLIRIVYMTSKDFF